MNDLRICLWSGPRNVSTALMYSFAQRSDAIVFDEPLYGHYLRVTGASHPGRAEVLAAMDLDGERVMRRLVERPADAAVVFMKHMAHHLVGVDTGFLSRTANLLLIRDPREMLPSLTHQLPHAGLADTGLARQHRLLDALRELGQNPPVLDAGRLLANPRGVLESLCASLGIRFETTMLRWPAGPKPYDGVWAHHWYDNVHRSTGFVARRTKREAFPDRLRPLLEACRTHYDYLLQFVI